MSMNRSACDDDGTVLFTGYYSPTFKASRYRRPGFTVPLYSRPDDLVTDAVTGEPRGRRLPDGSLVPWPARRDIESSGILAGTEIVWLKDPLSAYVVHVNGSARLQMLDGTDLYLGYGGKTDRPYTGLGGRSALGELATVLGAFDGLAIALGPDVDITDRDQVWFHLLANVDPMGDQVQVHAGIGLDATPKRGY